MVARKPRIVIVGAGMAGLTAANRLQQAATQHLDMLIVEASHRIGGRICSSEFAGDGVELGATWIHGIGGSPVHKIAERIGALESDTPWERMDGPAEDAVVKAEGGPMVDPAVVQSVSNLYKALMEVAQGRAPADARDAQIAREAVKFGERNDHGELSIGGYLLRGLQAYWLRQECHNHSTHCNAEPNSPLPANGCHLGSNRRLQEEGVFAIHENTERTYTSADSLFDLDFEAEKEYREFPGEQITIAKGYSSVLKSLASILPPGTIQFGKKIERILWSSDADPGPEMPVRLYCEDGSVLEADHVIITVSLGVLKAGTASDADLHDTWRHSSKNKPGLFHPPLPPCKLNAISKLGFGVVNKLFLQIDPPEDRAVYPFLQLAFGKTGACRNGSKVPWWMRKTVSLCPIYRTSRVLLAWFAGTEALELECLSDEEIIRGVSATLASFGARDAKCEENTARGPEIHSARGVREARGEEEDQKEKVNGAFRRILRSRWGFDPLFRGSYSYVAVGSSGQDFDTMAEPLPKRSSQIQSNLAPPLQLLFAGEATHRTHYSTTHGAYFSGLREANRLLQHYGWINLEPS